MSFRYSKSVRVRTRRQYQRIAHQATSHVGHWVVIEARQGKNLPSRLGITVSRRYGKAVQRNRFKRLVREAFRLCRQQLQMGFDLNVKPRSCAHGAKMPDIMAEFLRFFGCAANLK